MQGEESKVQVCYQLFFAAQTNFEIHRDHEFDLQNDRFRCLHGLASEEMYNPSDVLRVTQVFDNPQFFIDGASSNDIVQGAIGDCWFVSALAMVCTPQGLVEKFCVAVRILLDRVDVHLICGFRETKRLGYMDSSSSATINGSPWSSTSKLLPIHPTVISVYVASSLRPSPNSKS